MRFPDPSILFLGIDPGVTAGGWGILDYRGALVDCGRWGTWERVRRYLGQIKIATIEMIQVRSDDTMEKMFSRSTMIENYGFWQGVCGGAGVSAKPVHPRTWKKYFGLNLRPGELKVLKRGGADKIKAEMSLSKARALWPTAPLQYLKDNGVADGLLIAEFGRARHRQNLFEGA